MQQHQSRQAKPTKTPKQPAAQDAKAPFIDHVRELRKRVFYVALSFIVGSALAYQCRDALIRFVMEPLGQEKLVYLTMGGGFSFIFQVSMYAGILFAAPVLIYHLYKFVVPALPNNARRHAMFVVFSSVGLLVFGSAFGYIVAIPAAVHFLTTFASSYVMANLTTDSYLNFVLSYIVGLGVLFQLPLLLMFWNWVSPLSGKKLFASERYIVLFAFVAAAMITPTPDIVNQCMIAIPIMIIYQLGVVAVVVNNRVPKAKPVRGAERANRVMQMAQQKSEQLAAQPHAQLGQLLGDINAAQAPAVLHAQKARPNSVAFGPAQVASRPAMAKPKPILPQRPIAVAAMPSTVLEHQRRNINSYALERKQAVISRTNRPISQARVVSIDGMVRRPMQLKQQIISVDKA